MRRTAQGFTLVELIIVISIIGILAAVALPRFINAQQDARIAKANAMLGSVKAAAALAKARCELDLARTGLTCTATGGTANMDGLAITMVNTYPTANAAGIIAAAQMVASDGLTISAGGAAAGAAITIDVIGGTVPNCRITYTASTAVGVAATATNVSTGC